MLRIREDDESGSTTIADDLFQLGRAKVVDCAERLPHDAGFMKRF